MWKKKYMKDDRKKKVLKVKGHINFSQDRMTSVGTASTYLDNYVPNWMHIMDGVLLYHDDRTS